MTTNMLQDRKPAVFSSSRGSQGTLMRTEANHGEAEQSAPAVVVRQWARHARCVNLARRDLRRELESWGRGKLADAAELVLSEMLTNAVQHARAPRDRLIETRYGCVPGGVRLEVHDSNGTRPVMRAISAEAESGRGLLLVDLLTGGRWGVSGREGVGKLVWAVIADEAALAEPETTASESGKQ